MSENWTDYRKDLEPMQLGELVDHLIQVRLEGEGEVDKQTKIKYIREEISRREIGRKTEKTNGKRGIQSVSDLL